MGGGERIGITVTDVTLRLFDFIHFHGNFSFEKGLDYQLTFNTGIGGDVGDLLGGIGLSDVINTFANVLDVDVASDFSTIAGLEYEAMRIGGTDISAFIGIGSPDFDKPFTEQELIGFGLDGLEFGMAYFQTALPFPSPIRNWTTSSRPCPGSSRWIWPLTPSALTASATS